MDKRTARVSIGMPVYNGARYLSQSVESLLAQTYTDFELLISDNASTDETGEICRRYERGDARIRYWRNGSNAGAAANYNGLVHRARGEFFKWAAHDDVCAPTYLDRCVAELDKERDAVLSYPLTRIIDEDGRSCGDYADNMALEDDRPHERFRAVLFRSEGECNAVFGLIRTETLRRTGIIGNYPASDMILLAELSLHGGFVEVRDALFERRDHAQTSVRANASNEDRAAWFDPKQRRGARMPHWRWLIEYARAIRRARVGFGETARSFAVLGKWARWNRDRLARELATRMGWGAG